MAFHIFRRPQDIPALFRKLIYASLILSICTMGLSLANFFGFISYFVTPSVTLLTWIYHVVMIIKQNRQPEGNPAIYTYRPSIFAAYFLALCLTGGLGLPIVLVSTNDPDFIRLGVPEILFTAASAGVMWGIAVESTKGLKGWRIIQDGNPVETA